MLLTKICFQIYGCKLWTKSILKCSTPLTISVIVKSLCTKRRTRPDRGFFNMLSFYGSRESTCCPTPYQEDQGCFSNLLRQTAAKLQAILNPRTHMGYISDILSLNISEVPSYISRGLYLGGIIYTPIFIIFKIHKKSQFLMCMKFVFLCQESNSLPADVKLWV